MSWYFGKLCLKHPEREGKRYSNGMCTACSSERSNEWRKRNLDKARINSKKWRDRNPEESRARARAQYRRNPTPRRALQLKKRGFTLALFERAKAFQKNCCAICRRPFSELTSKNIHADHNHSTGKGRGILCRDCNTGLGAFKDSADIIFNAAIYLMFPTIKGSNT